ncbi:MAG TPA: death-on-curing protein, partial [Spirochaetaceae bacterium]|nr:death-on-curing protein [Spirochaetaceae bacterium]
MTNQVQIYKTSEQDIQLEVRFDEDSVWLTQQQMALLFEQTKQNISLHINNCFKEKELIKDSVVKESLTTAADEKQYWTKYYNLDVIISVGYRVKSKHGTQFRQWATKRLKDYLVEGYVINQKRLAELNLELKHLKEGISILHRAIEHQAKTIVDAEQLAALLEQFSEGLLLLDDYDHDTLDKQGKTRREMVRVSKDRYLQLIEAMRTGFSSDVFGIPKDDSFDSSINTIYQVFGGFELYPTLEEKAAMLLYLIVKNHSFVDGNKRIAAACFLYFMEQNGLLYGPNGTAIISNDALASITLFIAVSKPDEME